MKIFSTRIIIGIVVMSIGVAALLNALEITDIRIEELLAAYWPVIVIIWGLTVLIDYFQGLSNDMDTRVLRSTGQLVTGIIVTALGVLLLGSKLDLIQIDMSILWKLFWPLIIIIFGFSLIRGKLPAKEGKNHWAFMGGIEIGMRPFTLQDGNYFAFMGGIDMDLNNAEIPEGETVLDMTAVMGGIDVKVPRDLSVICEGTALLGGIDFLKESTGGIISTKKIEHLPGESQRRVRFIVRTLMGGISIQH